MNDLPFETYLATFRANLFVLILLEIKLIKGDFALFFPTDKFEKDLCNRIFMKKSLKIKNLLMMAILVSNIFGQVVTTPRPVSPAAELKQTIGLSQVTVNYSRPRLTLNGVDRTGKIWGTQVPYRLTNLGFGTATKAPWRAGANENTVITFSDDVKIDGKPLPAGKYGFHIIVYEGNKATLIFSKTYTSWGSFYYDESEDALRVDIITREIPKTEILTYDVTEMGTDFGVLALSWDKKQFAFKLEFDVPKIVLQNFRNELRSTASFTWQGFESAAAYCLQNQINYEEAIKWIDASIRLSGNFKNLSTKAQLLTASGKKAEGDKILDDAVAVANQAEINNLGYQLLGQNNYPLAIKYFILNTQKYPTDANTFDSLGEAYKVAGDKENAIKNLKKALTLNPLPAVKANSEKLLKELGAL